MHSVSKAAASLFILLAILFSATVRAIVGGGPSIKSADTPQMRVDGSKPSYPRAGAGSIAVGDRHFSAELIGPRHVLTAAHGVYGAKVDSGTFILHADGDSSHRIAARAVHVNPGYQGFIKTEVDVVHHVEPAYPLYTGHLYPGTPLTMVGYGVGGDGGGYGMAGGAVDSRKYPAGLNSAGVQLPDEESSGWPVVYLFEFDGPDAATNQFGSGFCGAPFASPVPELEPAAYWLTGLLLLGWVASFRRERTSS